MKYKLLTRITSDKLFFWIITAWLLLAVTPNIFWVINDPSTMLLQSPTKLYYPYEWRLWIDTPYLPAGRETMRYFIKASQFVRGHLSNFLEWATSAIALVVGVAVVGRQIMLFI